MQEREKAPQGRFLHNTKISEYTLLNNEKLTRVLDLIDGVTQPTNSEESRVLSECRELKGDLTVLALYDRLGGGIRHGERKLITGTFYDFKARKPRTNPVINEDNYDDEMVVVRKQARKSTVSETPEDRVKRIQDKESTDKQEATAQPEEPKADGEEPKVQASDAARRVAEEEGVDLATVQGTGKDGNITVEDVRDAAAKSE